MNTEFGAAAIFTFRVIASDIGSKTTIPNWPSQDVAGLTKALTTWTLSPHLDMSSDDPTHPHAAYMKPFRGLCFGSCVAQPIPGTNGARRRYIGTKPIYADHPNAVRYCGNFAGYSFGFTLDTDDDALINYLDGLIAANMASPEYKAEVARNKRSR